MAKKPAKFAKEKKQDVVGGKKMPWGFEAQRGTVKTAPKKSAPRLSKGAQNIANTLAGGGMTMSPPPMMGMPANGPMNMGMMGPEMKTPPMPMKGKGPMKGKKMAGKGKAKKK